MPNVETYREMLERLGWLFDYPVFLFWGTLLGCVRDGKIIPWDEDVDLAVFSEDYHPEWAKRIEESGVTVSGHTEWDAEDVLAPVSVPLGFPNSVRCRYKDHKLSLQVWAPGKGDGLRYLYVYPNKPSKRGLYYIPERLLYPLKDSVLEGMRVHIPSQPEEVLAILYGEGWRTPVVKYNGSETDNDKWSRYAMRIGTHEG